MNFFSYVVEHDYGLAPNPFGGYCTLAVCKPKVRGNKSLNIGDWVLGTGGKKLKMDKKLIYLMKVSEKISFNEYYDDSRFQSKKPIPNGSLVQIFGDNFYHLNNDNFWEQDISAHSFKNKQKHIKTDTSFDVVLISKEFYYFGDKAVVLPDKIRTICKDGPGMKYKGLESLGEDLLNLIRSKYAFGIHGDPISWKEFESDLNQYILEI